MTVTPHGVDPAFAPGDGSHDDYLLFVGAVQARKDPLAALAAARAVGLPLVVAGPEKEPELARELRAGGADVRGCVEPAELARLYQRAAALVLPSRYEGFGIPVARGDGERHAGRHLFGRRRSSRLRARPPRSPPTATSRVRSNGSLADRERYRQAGLERARLFTWRETARLTAEAYRSVLAMKVAAIVVSHGHPQRARRSRCPRSRPRSTSSS